MSLCICLLMGASFAGCDSVPTGTQQPSPSVSTGTTVDIIEPTGEFVQQPSVRDYSYMWWKNGFLPTGGAQLNVQTGYYGMSIQPRRGQISTIGAISAEIPQEQAGAQDDAFIDSLSVIKKMDYSVTLGGVKKKLRGITPIDYENDITVSNCYNGDTAVSRIIESGRYMQCIDIMNLEFESEKDVSGRVEIAAMPKYLSLEFSLWSREGAYESAGLEYSMTLGESYISFQKSDDGRVITAKEVSGSGLTVVLPEIAGASMSLDENGKKITVVLSGMKLKKRSFSGVNVIIIPSVNASLSDADEYYRNAAAVGSAVQIHPKEGREQKVEFTSKGYLSISLNNMLTYMGPDFNQEERLDEMDRLAFTVENSSSSAIKIPIQFLKTNKLGVLGCSPFLRDAETGEPIGVQVQLSKNWHEPVNYQPDDPKTWLTGYWFHGYTYLEVPANSSVTYEFTMTYAKWGGVFAASHSQICLAGWGGNYQQWETSSIGSFGESFCYEPEITHGRGFIDDIRPLLVTSIYGGKYNWTENIGGGNFLVYYPTVGGQRQSSAQVKTQFRKQGPNLTEVIYRGITQNGKIEYEYTVNLPRTDDVSRAYHTFKYTFLEDTEFDRLAFYQFGADYFNDNHYGTMAVGNDDGQVSLDIGGQTYSGEFALPVMDKAAYIGSQDKMQRVDIGGEGLWVAFMGYEPVGYKTVPGGNRMLNVMSYQATINGKEYTKPSLSFYHTMDGGIYPCVAVEISPPAEAGNVIKKGSVVCGTVEWLNIPVQKSDYYGPSSVIAAIPAEDFNTYKAAYAYAKGGKYTVTAQIGTVEKNTPIYVRCADEQAAGKTAAQITVTGGMGYVPLTFTGVKHYSGYHLEKQTEDGWEKVDQSVYGNDYWQAWYDGNTGTYELTYNVEHYGKGETVVYRLVKD